jgi:hypothetical protein
MPEHNLPSALVCRHCGSPVARSTGFYPRCGHRIGPRFSIGRTVAVLAITVLFGVVGLFGLAFAACVGTNWNSGAIPPVTMTAMDVIAVVLFGLWILVVKTIFN